MTFATVARSPTAIEPHGRQIDGHLRVVRLVALAVLLTILGGCANTSLNTASADEVFGVAKTDAGRTCRLNVIIANAMRLYADQIVDGDDSGKALNFLRGPFAQIRFGLAKARAAEIEFRDRDTARVMATLAELMQGSAVGIVRGLATSIGVMDVGNAVDIVSTALRNAAIADGARVGVTKAMAAVDEGARSLDQCIASADADLDQQERELNAVADGGKGRP